MIYPVLYSYLLGWAATSIGLALTARRLNDPVRPQLHPMPLAVAAGATWPLVVLGAAQMAIIALGVDVARSWSSRSIRERSPAFASNELDDYSISG